MGMFINESNFMSKLVLQPKIKKINKQQGVSINGGNKGIENLIKNHYNPGLRQIINTSKDIDELQYIRKDTRTIFPTLEKIRDRIKLCKTEGETPKTSSYYKHIKTNYIDNEITEKDVQKTIDELNKDMETITKRIQELKKSQNESFEFFDTDIDLLEMVEMEQLFSEDYVEEGLFFNKLPKELEELKNKLKQNTKEKYNEIVKSTTVGHRLKHGIRNLYPKVVDESLEKSGINPKTIIHTVTTDSNGGSYDTYEAFFIYKNYIVSTKNINGAFRGLNLLYDPDKCQIPKNVAFDLFNSTRTNKRFKSGKDSVTSAGLNDDGKDLLAKMENKYSDEYDVKRNKLTDSITISVKKKK